MNADIFYFTGTGNSLFVARKLSEALSGKVGVFSIKSVKECEKVEIASDCLVIVCPVYFQTLPRIVELFLKKLELTAPSVHIYGVVTCNGGPGHSLFTMDKILRRRGRELSAGFTVDMPGNSLIIRDFTNPPEIRSRRFNEAYRKISEISEYLKNRQSGRIEGSDRFRHHLQGIITGGIAKHVYRTPAKFRTSDACTKCGTCIKVCPSANIKMGGRGVEWGGDCEQCLACFHWCPCKAVEIGSSTAGKLRYHNPEISITDMYREL